MKLLKIIIIIFLALTIEINADTEKEIINNLQKGGNLIFIRHAYAPGNGDPENFDINNCETQRNLSQSGRLQSKKIGNFFKENEIPIKLVISSEWCRCKETASIAFKTYETKKFLNSFYSAQFVKNKSEQIKEFNNFIKDWDKKQNLIFVTHYVFILEILNYAPSSGEIVIVDKDFNIVDTVEIKY